LIESVIAPELLTVPVDIGESRVQWRQNEPRYMVMSSNLRRKITHLFVLLNGNFTFAVVEVTFDTADELKVSEAVAVLAETVLSLAVRIPTRLSRRLPVMKPLEVLPAVGLVAVDTEAGTEQS
jgi:hypothetical protein